MAPKIHFLQVIPLILSLLALNKSLRVVCSSSTLEREVDDHEKWISWNVENYRKKTASLEAGLLYKSSSKFVDVKLRDAEINRASMTVSQDGTGDFKTITEAIHSLPLHNTRRVVFEIKPGVYREKIALPRNLGFLTMKGSDPNDPPTITGNDTASVTGRDGKPLKTFQSATVAIDADYFIAINLIFENISPHEVGSIGGQGVALRISGTKAAFYNCSFYGTQDTLYDHKGLHYFKNCFIQGSVDFIFGYARSLYENCTLKSIARKVASVTAQKRSSSSMESGFSFMNSKVMGNSSGGGGKIYLGRAWGDFSRVVFSYTFMDSIVLPQGWSDWGKRIRDDRVYYGEYKCSGPGANSSGRVPWVRLLTDEEAQPFLGTYYIDGDTWLTNTSTYF